MISFSKDKVKKGQGSIKDDLHSNEYTFWGDFQEHSNILQNILQNTMTGVDHLNVCINDKYYKQLSCLTHLAPKPGV